MSLIAKLHAGTLLVLVVLILSVSPLNATSDPFNVSWSQIMSEQTVGVDWSPSGSDLVAGLDKTGEIVILDWQTGAIKQRTTFPNQSSRLSIQFSVEWSPDNSFIATYDQAGKIYIFDPEAGQLRLLRESSNEFGYFSLDWSPDSQSVAALNNSGDLDIISLKTGEIIQTIDVAGSEMERAENSGTLYSIFDWSPDGNFFVAPHNLKGIAGHPPVMGFWNRDGDLLDVYTQETISDSIPVSPCSAKSFMLSYNLGVRWANDSRTLAVSGDEGYGICRLNIDGTITEYSISDFVPDILRWSPDQKWLAVTNGAINTCSIELVAVADDYQTIPTQVDSDTCFVNALAWSPDSQHLAVSTDKGIWIGTFVSSEPNEDWGT